MAYNQYQYEDDIFQYQDDNGRHHFGVIPNANALPLNNDDNDILKEPLNVRNKNGYRNRNQNKIITDNNKYPFPLTHNISDTLRNVYDDIVNKIKQYHELKGLLVDDIMSNIPKQPKQPNPIENVRDFIRNNPNFNDNINNPYDNLGGYQFPLAAQFPPVVQFPPVGVFPGGYQFTDANAVLEDVQYPENKLENIAFCKSIEITVKHAAVGVKFQYTLYYVRHLNKVYDDDCYYKNDDMPNNNEVDIGEAIERMVYMDDLVNDIKKISSNDDANSILLNDDADAKDTLYYVNSKESKMKYGMNNKIDSNHYMIFTKNMVDSLREKVKNIKKKYEICNNGERLITIEFLCLFNMVKQTSNLNINEIDNHQRRLFMYAKKYYKFILDMNIEAAWKYYQELMDGIPQKFIDKHMEIVECAIRYNIDPNMNIKDQWNSIKNDANKLKTIEKDFMINFTK